MNDLAERWKRVEALCQAALALPASERHAFLRINADDEEIWQDVERLLEQESRAEGFLESSDAAVFRLALTRAPLSGSTPNGRGFSPLLGVGEAEAVRYDVSGEYARGGLGRILLAHDKTLGRRVALKELLERNERAEQRFVREALITARLEHPGIVPIYEMGRWSDGTPFYAMRLLDGRTLKELIVEAPGLAERLKLVPHCLAVADAVAFAHSKRVVHRDLKPANVIAGAFGETIVVDWGLARDLNDANDSATGGTPESQSDLLGLTAYGSILGTPGYMPPEQARGDILDERADVYSLGAILYEILAGCPPHATAGGVAATLEAARTRAVIMPEDIAAQVPVDLLAIVKRATERDRSSRYQDASEFATDLRLFLGRRLVKSVPATAAVSHEGVYARPGLYELAFSYRDIPAECDFLLDVFARAKGGGRPVSFLEVAAGPAVHGREFARRGLACTALDNSAEMVSHGVSQAGRLGIPLEYVKADMASFALGRRFALAACMLDSLSYLHTNQAVLIHLKAVADVLEDGGIYVVELAHPAELFRRGPFTRSTWEIEDESGLLEVAWRPVEATFDTVSQCMQFDVVMKHTTRDGVVEELRDASLQRLFGWNEIEALVLASGCFEITHVYGALRADAGLGGGAWRMIPVLRKLS